MHEKKWADQALKSFDDVVGAIPGFRNREGQRKMAAQVAQTLSQAQLGKIDEGAPEPTRSIAVVQAGTGVGKSLAYSIPAISMALARGTRVLISTATVALQEQLVNKDLPALAQQLEQPFKFALAKGRGRFVCKLKLERLASTGEAQDEDLDDLFAEEKAQAQSRVARPALELEARMQFYKSMANALASQAWDGDRDSLETPPEAEAWSPVAAESSSCTGKHCPAFSNCVYYERRKDLVAAQVIVANHDLLLSSLGARLLPELDNCLLVLDEAHHLPATALGQFAGEMDLSRLGWIDKLTSRALRVNTLVEVEELADLPSHASQLRQQLQELARLVMELYGDTLKSQKDSWGPARVRVPRGMLPEPLLEPLGRAAHHANSFLDALRAISKALRAAIKDNPEEARRLSTVYAQVGALAPRLESVYDTAQLLMQQPVQDDDSSRVPNAKWFTLETDGEYIVVKAHASPILPGATLRHHLWSQVRGAVLTSATLTSCGQFDFFLREAGLHDDAAVTTLEVPSPFDYARQGTLVARETVADPKEAARFTQEMVDALLGDLSRVQAGALVLFTSREQMRLAVDALSTAMRSQVLVQTAMPRALLLARHRDAVEMGEPSIIFGMQSFGEGLDLPGALCESLFITKLPFAPPDDPVGEARAEWLRSSGRNPFNELVVPATAIRLAQWVGRAIRTEEDQAHVYCYDRRLVNTSYGQQLLKGLPPFALQRRPAR
ncbi:MULTISPECIES: ATP-dependent DNA helicase DinG [Delftia]|uniref:ATP-dependent DNA helicase DinG n=1 Tax=Delftia TaxID=80865 RepID=UPI000F834EFA|nr:MULTISPECIES: ATP-dependent DNA helicase DinG [Delftia]MDH0773927.1 ATP-dependent DNA helicase DinG [Delftia tsuruhatensis]MDH0847207.1 ATP-dependent DNA helicase DinG [Delftia tsuruhatensis]MDH1458516.1 ATP-dependent DNA helicase DinG [Delftia tsuruhatensis]MDH1822032.1 ATP-dependent DNA helicase DinG [Delftia tsuruhatensis]WEL98568.1 ATP-dependent DNA helicase DinG [Delftia tsuruhatensis]